jgi:endonuclease G
MFDTVECVPVYSAYIITKDEISHPIVKRAKETFKNEKSVPCVHVKYYSNSGYDKGHLTPAADMEYSQKSMDDCFYITNICPQIHEFNAGIWEHLENKVRDWAVQYDSLLIISAPVLKTCTSKDNLTVPAQFYKIIYSFKQNKATAFLMDANLTEGSIFNYQTTVSKIDSLTTLNYFNAKRYVKVIGSVDSNFWK